MRARPSTLGLHFTLATLAILGGLSLHELGVLAKERDNWHEGLPRQYHSIWLVHDDNRPKPPRVMPGETPMDAPSDAIILFDGKDLSNWNGKWNVENGYMEVNHTGSITTKGEFGDCQLHLEYRSPTPVQKKSQARGNSGILFMKRYEVQVLDNHDNETYADGYIGSVYGQHPPMVNACKKPGEWQTYDIIFRRPRFNEKKELVEPARITVFLNGVLVQHNAEVYGKVRWRGLAKYEYHDDAEPIQLQDHGDRQNPRFRNIWIRKLDLSHEALDNRNT